MCLSCEMAAAWFAEMEKAARDAAAAPDHESTSPSSAGPPGGGELIPPDHSPTPQIVVNASAPARSFRCEPTNRK